MKTDRNALRQQLLAKRALFDQRHLVQTGQAIACIVRSSQLYRQASAIHCFAGAVHKGEIATLPLCASILADGKKLVMPVTRMKDRMLLHINVTDLSKMTTNRWGIAEPIGEKWVDGVADLVLVPGLAADRSGNRLGYGMGFYDRFLAGLPASTQTILLLESRFLLDHISAEPHDIPVSHIATEKEILDCSRNNTC